MNFYTLTSKLYDVLDVTYFNKQGKNPRAAINDLIQGRNVSILDMCCGTLSNSISIAHAHKDADILGIDISKQMLQVAQRKIEKTHVRNISLKELDATDTPLEANRFDYVVIGLALHEMSPELKEAILHEAHRVLKPEGSLIVLEWEQPTGLGQKILFFPLLIAEQLLCKSFLEFYHCDKTQFFAQYDFTVRRLIHCNYSAVFELKKASEPDC